jgi:hypothetical protein
MQNDELRRTHKDGEDVAGSSPTILIILKMLVYMTGGGFW